MIEDFEFYQKDEGSNRFLNFITTDELLLYKKAGNYKTKEYFLRLNLKYRKKTKYD